MEGAARKALVLGGNGQDGSYLSEILVSRGHDVTAVARQPQPRWPVADPRYRYRACDIADTSALEALLDDVRPGIIFHFAAIHGAAGFDYAPVSQVAHLVNTQSVRAVLDHVRRDNPACGFIYASSAKVFGAPLPARISEQTPRVSTCVYSSTKNAAHDLIDEYRARHGLAASVLYLFNHESPRRSADYFTPRIAKALARARRDGGKTELQTLDFACDWGDAREYMGIAADIGERGLGEDYVLASGKTWTGREMVAALFARHGLDYRDHLVETAAAASSPVALYHADVGKLRGRLGRTPRRSVLDVLDEMAGLSAP
jgi:GDPmannose 4,6-dehydratase